MWTLAEERGNSIVAGGTLGTCSAGTVVDVLAAVVARPSVHAHTVEPANGVVTRSSVLTSVRREFALVYVVRTVLTWRKKGSEVKRKVRQNILFHCIIIIIILKYTKVVPVQCLSQWQLYVLTPSIHLPPFSQACWVQSSTLCSHVWPVNPERDKWFTFNTHQRVWGHIGIVFMCLSE